MLEVELVPVGADDVPVVVVELVPVVPVVLLVLLVDEVMLVSDGAAPLVVDEYDEPVVSVPVVTFVFSCFVHPNANSVRPAIATIARDFFM